MSDGQQRRATLHDVARLAGVSYQTVSRVINNHPSVAPSTRAKVLNAIQQLDYHPNQAAQVLATGRSHTLQLLTYDLEYSDPLPAIVHWAKRLGYSMVVSEFEPHAPKEELRDILKALAARVIDGIILFTPYPIPDYAELMRFSQDTPIVVASTRVGAQAPSVVVDQRRGTELAVDHLLALDHRQIAEISGPMTSGSGNRRGGHYHALVRYQVLRQRLQLHDLAPGPSVEGDFTIRGGYEAAKRLLDMAEPFTAIFIANDRMALGAIRALRERGLNVPNDVSVVGFDDMMEAAYFDPPLTTVRQDLDALGKESVEYLISLVENPGLAVHQRVIYPELIVRQSTRRLT